MILPKIRVLHSHGRQAIPDLDAVELTPEFRGRPCLTETRDADGRSSGPRPSAPPGALHGRAALRSTWAAASSAANARASAPRNVRFTNDYRIGSPTREGLVVRPGDKCVRFDPAAVRPEIGRYFSRSHRNCARSAAGGDASVEMELNATGNVNFDLGRLRHRLHGLAAPCRRRGGVRPRSRPTWPRRWKSAATPSPIPKSSSPAARKPARADCSPAAAPWTAPSSIRTPPDLWLPGAPTHPMTFIDGILNLLGKQNPRMTMQRLTNDFRLVLEDRAFHLRRRIRHAAAHRAAS